MSTNQTGSAGATVPVAPPSKATCTATPQSVVAKVEELVQVIRTLFTLLSQLNNLFLKALFHFLVSALFHCSSQLNPFKRGEAGTPSTQPLAAAGTTHAEASGASAGTGTGPQTLLKVNSRPSVGATDGATDSSAAPRAAPAKTTPVKTAPLKTGYFGTSA